MSGIRWQVQEVEALKRLMPKYYLGDVTREDLERVFHRSFTAIQSKGFDEGIYASDNSLMDVDAYNKLLEVIDG